ncbi:MAG: AAA family ATPase [Cypionkella sp.]
MAAARRDPRIDALPKCDLAAPSKLPRLISAARGLFGRESEAGIIADALEEVARDRRCVMPHLSGPPGIGKTRMLQMTKALAHSRGGCVIHAAAFEAEAIRPFAMWIDALQTEVANGPDFAFDEGGMASRDRLFSRLIDFVARESSDRPVVVLFDDLQWCDESSAAALHYVARMNKERAFLGVLAARDGELRDNAAVMQALRGPRKDGLLREIALGPLSAKALAQIIDEQAPGADSARLSAKYGGNPLSAIELAGALTGENVAGSLDELIRDRLYRFGVNGAEVLRWAAVLSPHIDVGRIANVCN